VRAPRFVQVSGTRLLRESELAQRETAAKVMRGIAKMIAAERIARIAAGVVSIRGDVVVVDRPPDAALHSIIPTAIKTYRNRGKIVPISRRVVRLGERGGLFEWRPISFNASEYQRVSLVPRDQQRCERGTLLGAAGVCGHVQRRRQRGRYGAFRLAPGAPEALRAWVRADQRARRRGDPPVPLPPDLRTRAVPSVALAVSLSG